MDRSHLKTVRTFPNDIEADVARQHLESAGITAFVRKDDYGGFQPALQMARGVILQVLEEDIEAAEEVLKSLEI
jgi:hypothetical protein